MVTHDTADDARDLLRALAMPFQLQCLLFVAMTSVLLGTFIGGGLIRLLVSILAIFLIMVWLTQYALLLMDDAANGVRESQTASGEMAATFLDARAWIHPALVVAAGVALYLNPGWPRLPAMIVGAALFPASLGACALTGRALTALHPGEMARVIRGLGIWYPLVVVFMLGCALLALVVARRAQSMILIVAAIEMTMLLAYAGLGGALYLRRRELGFEPRISPERTAERQEDARKAQRQQVIDALYKDLRVRESARATREAARWLREAGPGHLRGDLHALLQAGTRWNEPREYPRLLRGLIPVLIEMKQPALALTLVDAGLATAAGFAPATEADTVMLIRYVLQTGRKRLAQTLLDNYLAAATAEPAGQLLALKAQLAERQKG